MITYTKEERLVKELLGAVKLRCDVGKLDYEKYVQGSLEGLLIQILCKYPEAENLVKWQTEFMHETANLVRERA